MQTLKEFKGEISFTKMHGLGNDFIVIDNLSNSVELSLEQIQFLSNRHFGIGFDQLLMIETSLINDVDFKYRIFNADGQEVEQCGNGARCFAHYVKVKGLSNKSKIKVETVKGMIVLYHEGNKIRVDMGKPSFKADEIPILMELLSSEGDFLSLNLEIKEQDTDELIKFSAVSVGNPHITLIVDNVETFPVEQYGQLLVKHEAFPEGMNIGFMQIMNHNNIKLRVYERGVGETQACGTGACAAVVNGIHHGVLNHQVKVQLKGGFLDINWQSKGSSVWMSGTANLVYEGKINL